MSGLKKQLDLNESEPYINDTILFHEDYLNQPQTQEAVTYIRNRRGCQWLSSGQFSGEMWRGSLAPLSFNFPGSVAVVSTSPGHQPAGITTNLFLSRLQRRQRYLIGVFIPGNSAQCSGKATDFFDYAAHMVSR